LRILLIKIHESGEPVIMNQTKLFIVLAILHQSM